MKTWIKQRKKDIDRLGKSKSPWVVFWNTPEGLRREKTCGTGRDGWRLARKVAEKINGELISGTYGDDNREAVVWTEFRAEYDEKILASMEAGNLGCTRGALAHFERLAKPNHMSAIKTQTIDGFIAKRRKERGQKKGDNVSPATVNKELRYIRAVLRIAHDWKYLPEVPKIRRLKEPVKLVTYITPEHFALIYEACDKARRPHGLPFSSADWWRSFLTYQFMTGWRVGEPLALRWADVDLDAGTAITRHADNKGNRDERVPLHPVVVEHLGKIRSFRRLVFPWPGHERGLWNEFARIQKAAGIHLPCSGEHEHTDACHQYGFHDMRRSFATLNAGQLTADTLQAMMRHRSYTTTQKYISMANQLDGAVASLHVPEVLLAGRGG